MSYFSRGQRIMFAVLLSVLCVTKSSPQDAFVAQTFSTEQQRVLSDVAELVLSDSSKADCLGSQCKILVANFFLPTKNTCILCMMLAKAITQDMTQLRPSAQIISWDQLRDFLKQQRIPYSLLNDPEAIRWVGKQLNATQLVFGTVEQKGETLDLKIRLLDTKWQNGKKTKGRVTQFAIPIGSLGSLLQSREVFQPWEPQLVFGRDLPASTDLVKSGFAPPTCQYAPNPAFSNEARDNSLTGVIIIEAELTLNGRIENPQVVQGLPYGLNQSALSIIKPWRCKPASKDGKKAASHTQFEITFQIY